MGRVALGISGKYANGSGTLQVVNALTITNKKQGFKLIDLKLSSGKKASYLVILEAQ